MQHYKHAETFQRAPQRRVVGVQAANSVLQPLAAGVSADPKERRSVLCYLQAEGANLVILISPCKTKINDDTMKLLI